MRRSRIRPKGPTIRLARPVRAWIGCETTIKRPNGPAVPRTSDPLGLRFGWFASGPRPLAWARRTTGPLGRRTRIISTKYLECPNPQCKRSHDDSSFPQPGQNLIPSQHILRVRLICIETSIQFCPQFVGMQQVSFISSNIFRLVTRHGNMFRMNFPWKSLTKTQTSIRKSHQEQCSHQRSASA